MATVHRQEIQTAGTRRVHLLFTTVFLFCLVIVPAGAVSLTIDASPAKAHIGDTITLNGTVSGISTIAVYLFVTGPGLDPRGVTLENLNIPAGQGLFTTAPVQMESGRWTYSWDTSVIAGTIRPGHYTVYAVSSPHDLLRFSNDTYRTAGLELLPSDKPAAGAPPVPALPVAALVIAALSGLCISRMREKRN